METKAMQGEQEKNSGNVTTESPLTALGGWQPIETAPQTKNRDYVLLYLSGEGYHGPRNCNVVVGIHTDSGWYYIADGAGGKVSNEPSHWMPLPAPPVSTQQISS